MLDVLRVTAYRKLFTAQIVALLGTGLLTVALGLLAFDLAGGQAGAVLGTALTIKMLAYVFVAPVMAAFVERLPRNAVLVCADLVRAGIALALPFIDQVWQICPDLHSAVGVGHFHPGVPVADSCGPAEREGLHSGALAVPAGL